MNIIGEGRIGKTQLLNYWKKGGVYVPRELETHGTLTTQYALPGTEYKATIWDFGGQSYHHGFHHVFLRPNDFYLVLWRKGRTNENPDYGYWLGTARSFSKPSNQEYRSSVVLVQNLWTETDTPTDQGSFQRDEAFVPERRKTESYGLTFDDIFVIDVRSLHRKSPQWKWRHDYFLNCLYQKMVEHTQTLLPEVSEKWLAIKEKLDENPIIDIGLDKTAFQALHAPGFDEAALAGLLDYLEFSGNIIKFPEPSTLSNFVFPNPPALSDWIYGTVLNKELINKSQGVLKYSNLQEKIGAESAIIFRKIMTEFNLLFTEKDNEDHLVIPQFLPENNSTFKRLVLELIPYSFCLRFADFFHESRIFQFISEYGKYADDNTSYWRYGLAFAIDEVNALVYYNQKERTLFVHLENKPGRIKIAQSIFDYFVYIKKPEGDWEELESDLDLAFNQKQLVQKKSRMQRAGSSKGVSTVSSEDTSPIKEEYRRVGKVQKAAARKQEKINPDELIEAVQLSVNRKEYIDIKETLRSNAGDFSVGISVKDRKPIKLDNLTLNLLGMMNRKLPKVFISFSRKDLEFKDELKTYLSPLEQYDLVKAWSCEEIQTGTWDIQIQTELEEADVIVYMVSQNFMASGYIMEQEVAKGIKMAQENPDKKIICVLVRNCLWKRWSFIEEKFKDVLDKDGKEVFSKDLSKYQFLPYHQYKNQEGVPIREEIVALEQWGRYPYDVSSVAFTQVAERILTEVTRKN